MKYDFEISAHCVDCASKSYFIPTLNDVRSEDASLLGKMLLAAKRIANEAGVAEAGYRTVFNCNAQAGQTLFHLHLHVLGGRALCWPPG